MSAVDLLGEIVDVGPDRRHGGYSRHVFDRADRELWTWFAERAGRLGLDVATGSHLDSVPGGGAFDGPLGVVSALETVAALRAEGFRPGKPVAVLVFAEEEGGRFGVLCLGSRLLTGSLDADKARALRDADGDALGRIGTFVELHVEQGRGLVDLGAPVVVGSTVIAHGRWRFSFSGQGNHARATPMDDRRDPMVPAAQVVAAARRIASTVGRLVPSPGGTNVIASTVDLWLDARVSGEGRVRPLADEIADVAGKAAAEEGCEVKLTEESYDGAVLSRHVRAGMLYVRNPTGISHAPEEFADDADVERGARALADVVRNLST